MGLGAALTKAGAVARLVAPQAAAEAQVVAAVSLGRGDSA